MQSDSDLVRACRQGDSEAWERLVQRYQRLIYTIPRRAGLSDDLAADVFQEVFATLLRKIDEIETPEKLKAWIVTTARRQTWRMINRDRRIGSLDDTDEDESLTDLPADLPLADDVLIQLEEQHRVRTAVNDLDERCRKLITLLFYEKETLPYAEIAARLGTGEGSIGPTRARCLQKLLRLLEK
ncbi:MAG TPA: sigma-70 family RNA polymerase sigma factor [Pyrinomonadaceae bacterium]